MPRTAEVGAPGATAAHRPPRDAAPAMTARKRKWAPLMAGADALRCCSPFNDRANGKTDEAEITLSPSVTFFEFKNIFSTELGEHKRDQLTLRSSAITALQPIVISPPSPSFGGHGVPQEDQWKENPPSRAWQRGGFAEVLLLDDPSHHQPCSSLALPAHRQEQS